MLIRNFNIRDHHNLKSLALKCWLFTYETIYSEKKIIKMVEEWYSETSHKDLIKMMNEDRAIAKVSKEKSNLTGFITLERIGKEFELKRLYVDSDRLNTGIGTQLLDSKEDYCMRKIIRT